MALHLVPDAPKPPETEADKVRKRVRSFDKPKGMIQCHKCGGREVIETKTGVFTSDGRKYSGGTKGLLCANCFMKGERVVLL